MPTGTARIRSSVSGYASSGSISTGNYDNLLNKPAINDVTLSGSMTSSDLGLQDALTESQLDAANSGITSEDVEQIGTNSSQITSIKSKVDRIVMDDNETTVLYFQSAQPSNPHDGDVWIS